MSIRLMKHNNWFHVGNMESKEKKSSYEGSGLSISIHPNEWRRIARLSGNLYTVTKEKSLFLDIHKLSKKKRKEIFKWGIEQGYLTMGEVFLYEYDDEGYSATMEFLTYDEWYSEFGYEAYDDEELELMKQSLKKKRRTSARKPLHDFQVGNTNCHLRLHGLSVSFVMQKRCLSSMEFTGTTFWMLIITPLLVRSSSSRNSMSGRLNRSKRRRRVEACRSRIG